MTVADLVGRERARLRVALIARGVASALALVALIAAIGTMALGGARWIAVPAAPLMLWIAAGVIALVIAVVSHRDTARRTTAARIAEAIEKERALRAGSLRGVLEVGTSGALAARAEAGLAKRLAAERALVPTLQRRAVTRGLFAAGAAGAAILLLAAAAGSSPDGWRAISHPLLAMRGDLLPPLQFVDVPPQILRGEMVRVELSAPERRMVELRSRTTGAAWTTRRLSVAQGRAEFVLGPLDADLILVATDGRSVSDTAIVRVTDRPFVGDVSVRATFPAYLQRPAEAVAVGEPARLPRGTSLQINGRASTVLRQVALVNGSDTLRLTADGHRFGGRMADVRAGRWTWVAEGAAGEITDVPAPLELEVVQDAAPSAEIVAPERDTLVLADAQVRLYLSAADDHALASVALGVSHRSGSGTVRDRTEPVAAPGVSQWSGELILDLARERLVPGDELRLTLYATDDSPWRQTAASRTLVLRVPTLLEQRELARALADSAVVRLERSAREQARLAQRSEETSRSYDLRRGAARAQAEARGSNTESGPRTASHETAERARALAAEQEALASQVEAARQEAAQVEQQLRAAGALDEALQQQLQDVQRLLSEAMTREMQERMQELLSATQQLSPEEMRRALEQLAREQQRMREQLERSAQMLRRAALEGAMQTLHEDARELAERERNAAERLSRGEREAAQEARELGRQSERLAEQVRELGERLERENANAGPQRMQQAAEEAARSAEAMQRAGTERGESAEQMRQRAESAREGAERMDQAARALEQGRSEQIGEWKEELTGEMDRAVQELSQLAREQQQLAERTRSGENAQQMRGEQSAVQQGVERVNERMQQAGSSSSHVTPQSRGAMAEAQRRVQDATRRASQEARPGGQETAASMEQAAQALERAAAQVARDRDRAARSQSASGFAELLEEMRQMAREQGSINAQASALLPMPGGSMAEGADGEARQLGQRQRRLADRLDSASDADPTGRAAELAREMRQIADALQGGRIDQQTVDRQQRLFRRLLDAGRTLERDEREDTGRRESRSAQEHERVTPGAAAGGRPAVRYREPSWNEMRDLSPEERRAVIEYFKRINAGHP